MVRLRFFLFPLVFNAPLAILLLATGCAVQRHEAYAVADGRAPLHLCSGVQVSNAPPADGARRVRSHQRVIEVRRIALLSIPTRGCLSSGFGPRRNRRPHEGVDISTRRPTPIVAAGGGRVDAVHRLGGYGLTVDIDHGRGVTTRYAHLSRIADGLREGARIEAGDRIGLTGRSGNATGVHLHYEVRVNGRPIDPFNAR
ncbi:MAG: M23 family metallopeptidase [Pseudomonadota bacterium]